MDKVEAFCKQVGDNFQKHPPVIESQLQEVLKPLREEIDLLKAKLVGVKYEQDLQALEKATDTKIDVLNGRIHDLRG